MNQIFYRLERLLFLRRASLLWVGYAYLVYRNFIEIEGALISWQHLSYTLSDWLINYADGMARRGLIGEVAVALSRWFGATPAVWAWFLSSLIGGIFFLFAIRLMKRLPDDAKTLPLILAPWGLLFFVYDTGASFRKETIGYLAISIILQGIIANSSRAARIWAVAGTFIFLSGIFAHEAIVFLLPALMLAFFLLSRHWPADKMWFAICAITCVMLGIVIFAIIAMLPSPDADLLCVAAKFSCNAPRFSEISSFVWMTRDTSEAIAHVFYWRGWIDVRTYAVFALLSALPFLGFRLIIPNISFRWYWAARLTPIVCMIPLFVIGLDWGRWIQMIFLPLAIVGIAALISGFGEYRRLLPPWASIAYVSTWSFSHVHAGYYFNALYLLPVLGIVVGVSWIWAHVIQRQST